MQVSGAEPCGRCTALVVSSVRGHCAGATSTNAPVQKQRFQEVVDVECECKNSENLVPLLGTWCTL